VSVTSGVAWAPDLPADWRHTTLGRICRIYAGGTPDRANDDYWVGGSVPWLNSGAVNDWDITTPSSLITKEGASGGRTRWAPPGSVVMALAGQGKTKGMAARMSIASTVNQSLAVIVPDESLLHYRYLHFWIAANYWAIRGMGGGDLRDGLNLSHVSSIETPLPGTTEQVAIADYLDRETAEIDAFIADQEELITLLTERRAATITLAVTKGVDSSVPTQSSDIDWLEGEQVPAGWLSMKLRWIANLRSGDFIEAEKIDSAGRFPVYGGGGLRGFTDSANTNGPHVLIGRQGALCGKVWPASGPFYATEHAVRVSPRRELDMRWLLATLDAMNLGQYSVSAAQPGISVDVISGKRLPVPPLGEQRRIGDILETEIGEIDAAIADAREAIALSKERRAALISAAVTGKIDVTRGAAA